jgi:hypothetical protein
MATYDSGPSVERVVVAVYDQSLDSVVREAIKATQESPLRTHAALRTIVDISRRSRKTLPRAVGAQVNRD